MRRRRILLLLLLPAVGCTLHPQALSEAPMPGIIGKPHYSTDDNSTTERVSFTTSVSEPEVRVAFEQYCRKRGLQPDPRKNAGWITWFQSDRESLGILVSGNAVTYFYNR